MYYRTLGVKRGASQDEIRRAYRALALQVHPDKPGGSQELFQKALAAYEVLGNTQSRAAYDADMEMKRSKLRGFKRPPPMEDVRFPVVYKLADDDYYEFETAPDRLKCTFKHGDIISHNDLLGVFVGLAADNYTYWCRDGEAHATKLCERGSFGMDSVRVVRRANFKSQPHFLPRSVHGAGRRSTLDSDASSVFTLFGAGGRGGAMSTEAERLRRDIMRRERAKHTRERMEAIASAEAKRRVRLVEKIEAAIADDWQSFGDWLNAGSAWGNTEDLPWIKHARKREGKAAELKRQMSESRATVENEAEVENEKVRNVGIQMGKKLSFSPSVVI